MGVPCCPVTVPLIRVVMDGSAGSAVTGGAGGSQAARMTAAPRAPAAARRAARPWAGLLALTLSFPDGGGTLVYS